MEDTNLSVDYEKLAENGATIKTNCATINADITEIISILNTKWVGWTGEDNTTYVTSFKQTLSIVRKYAEELKNIAKFLEDASSDYKTAITTCIEGLNSD